MAMENSWRKLGPWVAGLRVLPMAALLMVCATAAMAQVPTGSITGTAEDSQGLPVEGVTVTLTNQETNATFSSVTGSSGGYQFEHVDYGLYKVSASKPGFKLGEVTGIKLDASTVYSVKPITLEVGSNTETVVV